MPQISIKLVIVLAILFLGPLTTMTDQRLFQYLSFLPICYFLLKEKRDPSWIIVIFSFVLFLCGSLSHWFSVDLNGYDSSVYDFMLASTWRDKFMYSPIYGINHFGVHQNWVSFLLLPFHKFFDHPLYLLTVSGVILWSAVIPLFYLIPKGSLRAAACISYLCAATVGTTLNSGYRPECFYPLGVFLLFIALKKDKPLYILLTAIFFLSIKEDAAIYLFGFSSYQAFFKRKYLYGGLAVFSVALFFINLKYFRPLFLGDDVAVFMSFWAKYGSTPNEIIMSWIQNPIVPISDILHSGIWKLYLPLLFIPLAYLPVLFASLPAILLLGTASGSQTMYEFGSYYPLVLLSFAIVGMCRVPVFKNLRIFLLLCFPLLHSGSIKVKAPRLDVLEETYLVKAFVEEQAEPVQVQAALFPFMGYENIIEISVDNKGIRVIGKGLDPYPFKNVDEIVRGCTAVNQMKYLQVYHCQ